MVYIKPRYQDVKRRKRGEPDTWETPQAPPNRYPSYSLFKYGMVPLNLWNFCGMVVMEPKKRWIYSKLSKRKEAQVSWAMRVEKEDGSLGVMIWAMAYGTLGRRLVRYGFKQFDLVIGCGKIRSDRLQGAKMQRVVCFVSEMWVLPRRNTARPLSATEYAVNARDLDQLALELDAPQVDRERIKRLLDKMRRVEDYAEYGKQAAREAEDVLGSTCPVFDDDEGEVRAGGVDSEGQGGGGDVGPGAGPGA
jgi:hypothetical protein